MNLQKYILDYMERSFGNNKNELAVKIAQCGLQVICRDAIKNVDARQYYGACVNVMLQNRRNKVFTEEIGLFVEKCLELDLKPIFFKGIVLAESLYLKKEERLSEDIDIVIYADEVVKYRDILYKLGYVNDLLGRTADIADYAKELQNTHLIFYKPRGEINVIIEIHISPINPVITFQLSKEFQEGIVQKKFGERMIWTYQNETNFLVLCLHFVKHMLEEYFQALILMCEWKLHLTNIHDVALLLFKEGRNMDWKKVSQIARDSHVSNFIMYILQYIDEIYPGIVERNILEEFRNSNDDNYIAAGEYEYLGLGKFSILFRDKMDLFLNRPLVCLLKGEIPLEMKLVDYALQGKRRGKYVRDYIYSVDFFDKEKRNIKSTIQFSWHSWGINVQVLVHKKKMVFYKEEGPFYDKDSIEIILIQEKCIIHRIFTLSNIGGENKIMSFSFNYDSKKTHPLLSKEWQLSNCNEDSCLEIWIPWEELGIDMTLKHIIPFNIAYLQSDPQTEKLQENHRIFGNRDSIWDIRSLGYLDVY